MLRLVLGRLASFVPTLEESGSARVRGPLTPWGLALAAGMAMKFAL